MNEVNLARHFNSNFLIQFVYQEKIVDKNSFIYTTFDSYM